MSNTSGISMRPEEFTALTLMRRYLPGSDISYYHVFRDTKDFVEVKADSASEAIQLSGIARPHAVRRHLMTQQRILYVQNAPLPVAANGDSVGNSAPVQEAVPAAPAMQAAQQPGDTAALENEMMAAAVSSLPEEPIETPVSTVAAEQTLSDADIKNLLGE